MSLHKLSPGEGYTYLARQVAAHDTSVPAGGLGAYYMDRGETPGRWLGSGLPGIELEPQARVTEDQMRALFGEGCHPVTGLPLGTAFPRPAAASQYSRQVAEQLRAYNRARGFSGCESVPAADRAAIRTAVGRNLFSAEHGRAPLDARELSSFIAQASRLAPDAVAGYDLTFSPVKSVSTLWALAPRPVADRIEEAHRAAIADTMRWIEDRATFTRLGRNGIRQVETRGLIAAAFDHRDSRAGDPDLHTHVAISNKVQTREGLWRALDGRVLHKAAVAASERYNTRLEAHLTARLGVRFADRDAIDGKRRVREIVGVDQRLMKAWSSRRAAIDTRRGELARDFQAAHGRPPTPWEAIDLAQQATLETRQSKHAPRSEAEQRIAWRGEAISLLSQEGLDAMMSGIAAGFRRRRTDRSITQADVDGLAEAAIAVVSASRATWQEWHVRAEAERQARSREVELSDLDAVVDAIVSHALNAKSLPLASPDSVAVPVALQRSDGTSVYRVAGSDLYTSSTILQAEQRVLDAARRRDGRTVRGATVDIALLEQAANGATLNQGQANLVRDLATSGLRLQLALAPAGTGKTTALRVLSQAWLEEGGDVVGLAPSAAAAAVLREATGRRATTVAKLLHSLTANPEGETEIRLGPRSLVIVDEAGMASTLDLAQLVHEALRRSASVRLIGDDRQLAAVGAGGVLRDLQAISGAVTLQEAVRFVEPDEAAAALALRNGETTGLDFYLHHGRVHVGDDSSAAYHAYEAWATDRAAGHDSLLIAARRETVEALNQQAQSARLRGQTPGAETGLRDGTSASAGDTIITRRNDRRLAVSNSDFVKNGDRWQVDRVHEDGSLSVTHLGNGRRVVLPSAYVADQVALGYATTIHGAQGNTSDTSHTVLTGQETREQLYVALTRGRRENHLHLALPGAAGENAPIARSSLSPPTARDLLVEILHTDGSQHSASSQLRELVDPARQLRQAIAGYVDAVELIPAQAAATPPALSAPLPWLPAIPPVADVDPATLEYAAARAAQVRAHIDELVVQKLGRCFRNDWVDRLSHQDPQLLGELVAWRACRLEGGRMGPVAPTYSTAEYKELLRARMSAALMGDEPSVQWRDFVGSLDERVPHDELWRDLAEMINQAAMAGYPARTRLPALINDEELPHDQPAAALRSRLLADCPAEIAVDLLRVERWFNPTAASAAESPPTPEPFRPSFVQSLEQSREISL
jgi:conjugative relaxase-like TrwC/TraI family protein